ncbi:uncharacterized protein VTP21DRAFT_11731 [Calcarisporiella thermophila]|uniref:uncharacterized protein n=1 Tax=Calcarisporiella thermophila TaxID=911321 RepID=UPI003743F81A
MSFLSDLPSKNSTAFSKLLSQDVNREHQPSSRQKRFVTHIATHDTSPKQVVNTEKCSVLLRYLYKRNEGVDSHWPFNNSNDHNINNEFGVHSNDSDDPEPSKHSEELAALNRATFSSTSTPKRGPHSPNSSSESKKSRLK